MEKWFICQNEKVTGPFSTEEVKAQYAGAQLPSGCLIWGRAIAQWQTIEWWNKESPLIRSGALSTGPATTTNETLSPSQQQWHYAIDGGSKGPLSRVELVNELRELKHRTDILVWTKGMKAWSDLYDFHDLLDELGLNRREHPRASISGNVVIKSENNTYIGQLRAISEGGFGAAQLNAALSIGQVFSVEIKSESLGEGISARAVVQYVSDEGYYGCKFQSLSMEVKVRITEYILRAKQNTTGSVAA